MYVTYLYTFTVSLLTVDRESTKVCVYVCVYVRANNVNVTTKIPENKTVDVNQEVTITRGQQL